MRAPFLYLLLLLLGLPGCDNPACLFGPGGCNGVGGGGGGGGPGAAGSFPAGSLETGSWITQDPGGQPILWPQPGTLLQPGSVFALEFSGSMSVESLAGAFELIDAVFATPVPLLDPPPLVADGRIALMVPSQPLIPGSQYILNWRPGADPADVLGRGLIGATGNIGSIAISGEPSVIPSVVAVYPHDGEAAAGDLTEVLVIFDQPMTVGDFSNSSFAVLVDGGPPPANPQPLPVAIPGAVPVPVTQAWVWSAEDAGGTRLSLGVELPVTLNLSPLGSELGSMAGGDLPATEFSFTIGSLPAPASAVKPFAPTSAIGLDDLSTDAPLVEAELTVAAKATGNGQKLGVVARGLSRANGGEIAVLGQSSVAEGEFLAHATGSQIGFSDGFGQPFLADGDVAFGVWSISGTRRSQVRLLDGELLVGGVQSLLLDTVPPIFLGFGSNGSQQGFLISDQTDMIVLGRATERIGYAHVVSSNGSENTALGEFPPVVISGHAGLFVAQPVFLGALDPDAPLTFNIEIADRALNRAAPILGIDFIQRGVLGQGTGAAGSGTLLVDVFDALTLEPLEGATVYAYQDDGALISFLGTELTDPAGRATPPASAGGALSLVTVELDGYDLFSIHGAPTRVLQVLLHPTNALPASVKGDVTAPVVSGLDLSSAATETYVADGRLPLEGSALVLGDEVVLDPELGVYRQNYGPYFMRPSRLGAQSAFVVNPLATELLPSFGPMFLLAFTLRAPAPPLPSGGTGSIIQLDLEGLLFNAGDEGSAIDSGVISIPMIKPFGTFGDVAGVPEIMVEARSPGSSDPWIVGLGKAFTDDQINWRVKAAWPGAFDVVESGGTDQLGFMVQAGAMEPELWVRADMTDTLGAETSVRAPVTVGLVGLPLIEPPGVAFPPPASSGVGTSFNLVLVDDTPAGNLGYFRGVLTDTLGRRWEIWRADPDGIGQVSLHFPLIGAQGGIPLSGALEVYGELWVGSTLDGGNLLWSEISRVSEIYARSGSHTFNTD